ncbi:MAG: hypothetical protein KDB93_14745 [Flavobacteriales bacterium]|nr:hypothetical protein [Flavobacteriales bacterium]
MPTVTPSKPARPILRAASFLLFSGLACGFARGQYIPPDLLGGEHQGSDVLRRNDGQTYATDGHLRPDVKAYFEGSPVNVYLRDSSRVSYTYTIMHQDSATADTAYRVDMSMMGGKVVSPSLVLPAPGVANYYRGRNAVEQVPAFYRGIYHNIKSGIDLHLYASLAGPRMAIVINPGADPSVVKLTFTGQDSLNVDWMGSLKMYVKEHWMELRQGTAYQVDTSGTIIPVDWTPAYAHQNGTAYVGFTFGTYDTTRPLVVQIGYGALGGGGLDARDMNWSTYVGGTGDDELTCVETDEDGNAYVCGHSLAFDFPVDPGNSHYAPFNPNAAGYDNAVVMKFDGVSKRVEWATYYGGAVANPANDPEEPHARTEARKLAVFTANDPAQERQYVFATGVTNCTDFGTDANNQTIFSGAVQENYLGGRSRMWVGAFKKEDGTRDWATTHGQGSGQYNSREEGLAIAVNGSGQVSVGGRLHRTVNFTLANPVFPVVTPTGAYDHNGNTGGAFVVTFNPNGTIYWSTTLGNYDQVAYTQLTDLRYDGSGRFLWFTGISSGAQSVLDLVTPTGSYSNQFGTAMIGEFNMTTGPSLNYCTRWGGGPITDPSTIGYGLDFDGSYMWVVGGTRRSAVIATDAPLPEGPSTIYHNLVNASDPGPGNPCDGFILKFDPMLHTLLYGTLIGGNKYDMLLDVGHDGENVYITGESRSTNGFATDLNPLRYFQPMNGNINTRDAVILGIRAGAAPPEMIWRTAFGGTVSERGWGIAGSTAPLSDVYLVGGTASQLVQAFPLHEFSTTSPLDYYQSLNLSGMGAGGSLNSWYRFEWGLDFENGTLGFATPEASHQGHDGFIASFAAYHPVGITEPATPGDGTELLATPLAQEASWMIHFPYPGTWKLDVYDATGRLVRSQHANGTAMGLDIGTEAPGMYLLRAMNGAEPPRSAKIIRP